MNKINFDIEDLHAMQFINESFAKIGTKEVRASKKFCPIFYTPRPICVKHGRWSPCNAIRQLWVSLNVFEWNA
jgi:hypothetical protein